MIRPALDWQPRAASKAYSDIRYEFAEGIASIVINRPDRRNAFRPETVGQLIDATHQAQFDPQVGVIILSGAGHEAFCSGGDQTVRGDYGGCAVGGRNGAARPRRAGRRTVTRHLTAQHSARLRSGYRSRRGGG